MARTSSGFSQALIYLEIIKRLPRHWVTSTEIMQSLKSAGIEIETLTLQRYLKELAESDEIPVERDTRSRPYGYRLASFSNTFSFLSPSPQESLLLKLIQEYLKYQLPGKLIQPMAFFSHVTQWSVELIHGCVKEWIQSFGKLSG